MLTKSTTLAALPLHSVYGLADVQTMPVEFATLLRRLAEKPRVPIGGDAGKAFR